MEDEAERARHRLVEVVDEMSQDTYAQADWQSVLDIVATGPPVPNRCVGQATFCSGEAAGERRPHRAIGARLIPPTRR
jgi:hypothetical protein